jgi:hypothetical protein
MVASESRARAPCVLCLSRMPPAAASRARLTPLAAVGGRCERAQRRVTTFAVTVLLIAVSVAVTYVALCAWRRRAALLSCCVSRAPAAPRADYQNQIPQDRDCPDTITQAQVPRSRARPRALAALTDSGATQALADDHLRSCYCKKLGVDLLHETTVECGDWLKKFIVGKLLALLTGDGRPDTAARTARDRSTRAHLCRLCMRAAGTIVLVNGTLKYCVRKLVKWELHTSYTEEQVLRPAHCISHPSRAFYSSSQRAASGDGPRTVRAGA